MRGLDDAERALYRTIASREHSRKPRMEEIAAALRLARRGCLAFVPCECGCGRPSVGISALGREVERLDKMAREGMGVS